MNGFTFNSFYVTLTQTWENPEISQKYTENCPNEGLF